MDQSVHILHLEDEPADIELAQANLEAAGLKFQITGVQNRAEFEAALHQGGYDIILADFRLPMYDGMSALLQAQERCPDVPFVFVSGTMGEDAVIEGLTKGATDYVLKQNLSRLAPAVNRALAEAENRRERQLAEKKLFQANERWGRTFDAVPDLIAIMDNDFRIVQANKAMAERLGLTPEECERQLCYKAVHGTEDPPSFCPLARSLRDGKEHMVEVKEERLGGDFIVSTSPMFDSQGQMTGCVHVCRDITERKKAEEALRTSEEQFRQLFDNAPIGIGVADMQGNLLAFNDAMLIPGQYSREDMYEMGNVSALYCDLAQRDEIMSLFRKQGFVKNRPVRFKRRDGTSYDAMLSLTSTTFNGKSCIQAIVEDITERMQAQEEKGNLEKQLQHAQKMEAIGTLAGGIAHDFNNILGIIIAFTEMSLMDLSEKDPKHYNLSQVLTATMRAKDLIKQILAFSRQSKDETIPINIAPLIKESLKLLRASLPTTIDIRQDLNSVKGTVMANPTQIQQIVMNLCTNAAHAMGEKGGLLTVKLDDVILDPHLAAMHQVSPGTYLKLVVNDTGCGIDSAVIDRIFDPYFTTKKSGEGTGLGLAVIHGIVKSLGGSISIDSEPGRGSSFQVLLPVIKQEAALEKKVASPLPRGKGRILFVDDESALAMAGVQMLRRLGYDAVSKTSSLEALDAFKTQPQIFDLVITDQTMPHMTGIKLAKEILNIRPDMPVILCTGFSHIISEEKARETGVREIVVKPVALRELAEAIHRLLG